MNVTVMKKLPIFFARKRPFPRKIKMNLSNSQMDSSLFLLMPPTISHNTTQIDGSCCKLIDSSSQQIFFSSYSKF